MDARAHLLSLGWAGPGHSLDSRPHEPGSYKQKGHRGLAYDPTRDPLKVGNTGNGLVKPLFISQRKNRFGVGKKAHEAPAGNEWWLKGFESALGNIGKSESERSSGNSTPVNGQTGKHGGLYTYFTQGQIMQGTIEDATERSSRKRRSDEFEEDNDVKLNPRPTSLKQVTTAHEFEMVGAFIRERDKEKTRRHKEAKAGDLEQFSMIGQFFDVAEKQQRRNKKKRKSEVLKDDDPADIPEVVKGVKRLETKEERRERRQKRREEKAVKATTNGVDSKSESEDAATKAARRAERKKRKADKAAKAKS